MQKEIDLFKILNVLKDNKKQISIVTSIFTMISIIYCIFATPIFTASVIINPPKLSDAGSGASQLLSGGLTGLSFGSGSLLSQKTDADIVIAGLKTRAIQDMIIKKFNLMKYYDSPDIEKARLKLTSKVKFVPDMKSGFVEIDVDDKDPKLASDIANYYTIALGQLISNIAYGKSNSKLVFFDQQLQEAKNKLESAQDALEEFSDKNGIIAGQQSKVAANLAMQLQAKIVLAQTQLNTMLAYSTPANPDYKQLQSQIASYKLQLDKLNQTDSPDIIGVPASLSTNMAIQYADLMREFNVKQEIYGMMVKQYEANRLDNISEEMPIGIQVVDPAQVPLYKSKPKRAFLVLLATLFGFFFGLVYVIIKNIKILVIKK